MLFVVHRFSKATSYQRYASVSMTKLFLKFPFIHYIHTSSNDWAGFAISHFQCATKRKYRQCMWALLCRLLWRELVKQVLYPSHFFIPLYYSL